ncbi:hypothetical protein [Seonamhaeicola marinus]|uniref:Uncharacterized protein n=1 Tax=Seonamhaeicola marinus TaxID=1912246 RepID=A0A5D0IL25_9FLAO|nr:hypothetical protein [Seonamhaeicola marinus]TYA84246.1 hypothetical protein FUA24_06250 [Seonamhaeicola marinus]
MRQNIIFILLLGIPCLLFSQKNEIYFDYLQKHALGGVENKYVLTLSAYLTDCGEFGGHEEKIEIKRNDRQLIGVLTIFETTCGQNGYKNRDKIVSKKAFEISDEKVQLVIQYIHKVLENSLNYEMVTHADNEYGVKLDWSEETDYDFKRIDISFRTYGKGWQAFEKLKSDLK